MNTGKIPEGMTAISPFLTVSNVDEAMAFYEKAFGFTKKMAMPGPGGATVHGEMQHGGSTMMFGPESEQCGTAAPSGSKTSFGLYLYVEDVDKFFAHALANGAKEKEKPQDMFWGDRICTLIDPFGHQWSFGTFVRQVSPEECEAAMKAMMQKEQMTPA